MVVQIKRHIGLDGERGTVGNGKGTVNQLIDAAFDPCGIASDGVVLKFLDIACGDHKANALHAAVAQDVEIVLAENIAFVLLTRESCLDEDVKRVTLSDVQEVGVGEVGACHAIDIDAEDAALAPTQADTRECKLSLLPVVEHQLLRGRMMTSEQHAEVIASAVVELIRGLCAGIGEDVVATGRDGGHNEDEDGYEKGAHRCSIVAAKLG